MFPYLLGIAGLGVTTGFLAKYNKFVKDEATIVTGKISVDPKHRISMDCQYDQLFTLEPSSEVAIRSLTIYRDLRSTLGRTMEIKNIDGNYDPEIVSKFEYQPNMMVDNIKIECNDDMQLARNLYQNFEINAMYIQNRGVKIPDPWFTSQSKYVVTSSRIYDGSEISVYGHSNGKALVVEYLGNKSDVLRHLEHKHFGKYTLPITITSFLLLAASTLVGE